MRKPTIFAAFLCIGASACQSFTASEPVSEPDPGKVRSAQSAVKPSLPRPPEQRPAEPQEPEADAERIRKAHEGLPTPAKPQQQQPAESATAAHILIRYVGTMRAGPEVTRSKAEAEKLAQKVLAQAKKKGANFAELADKYTEDPSGKGRGGKLGTFPRGRMVPEFDKATFGMKPGEVSAIVETAFGYHIIYREQ